MNKLQIIKDDGAIAIDGVWKFGFDLSDFPGHALQWENGKGELERTGQRAITITRTSQFKEYIALWEAAKATDAGDTGGAMITNEERVDLEYNNFAVVRALINRQAEMESITPSALLDELKTHV